MPNRIERFFRAMILYTGLLWIVTGLWGIPVACVQWNMWDSNGIRRGNELYCLVLLLLVYGSRPIVGLLCVSYFRKLANRQYQQIPGIAEMQEPKWHDTAVFTTLIATGTGLYCLHCFFCSLYDLINPLMMIGQSLGDLTGIAVIDVWYYHWQSLLFSIFCLACVIVLLMHSGKIADRVTQMIDTTPPPKEGDADEQSD